MRLLDLAEAVAPGVARKIVGVRAGEKLHELLISSDAAHHTYEFKEGYVTTPDLFREGAVSKAEQSCSRIGKKVPQDFVYASDKNSQWLSVAQLRELLKEI
jgi:UDP-N-acetylglucosamine 4,6-dehydratase